MRILLVLILLTVVLELKAVGPDPLPQMVFDSQNYMEILANGQQLINQTQQLQVLGKQLGDGDFNPNVVMFLASNLYSCDFRKIEVPGIDIPNLNLLNICSNFNENQREEMKNKIQNLFFVDSNNAKDLEKRQRLTDVLVVELASQMIADIQASRAYKKQNNEASKTFESQLKAGTDLNTQMNIAKSHMAVSVEQLKKLERIEMLLENYIQYVMLQTPKIEASH
jgi:hypothetical protein